MDSYGTRERGAPSFVSQAFVQKVDANGDYATEVVTDGGFAITPHRIGGVCWINPSDGKTGIALTGISGLAGSAFFA